MKRRRATPPPSRPALLTSDQHPDPGPPTVRGRARTGPADQGPRPALPGHLHRRPNGPVIFHSDRGRPVHQPLTRRSGIRVGCSSFGRAHRPVLGQRPRRVVLRDPEAGVARRGAPVDPGNDPHRDLRVDRGLVQHTQAAQQPRLPQSRRVRDRPLGLTTTTTVPVRAEQAQGARGAPPRRGGSCPCRRQHILSSTRASCT